MRFTEGHALVVGVGSYLADPQFNVPQTAWEAENLTNVLTDERVGAYPPDQVTLLHDEAATLNAIILGLEELADRVGPDDTALVYLASHGMSGDDGEYYFAVHDTLFSPSGHALQGTGLNEQVLLEKVRALECRKLLLIINACFSGRVRTTLGGQVVPDPVGVSPSPALATAVLASGHGRAVMTASRGTESSYYNPSDTHGTIFGGALVEGLHGGGRDAVGFISLFDLYRYVHGAVSERVSNLFSQIQEPVLNLSEVIGSFPVALYRGQPISLGSAGEQEPGGAALRVLGKSAIDAGTELNNGLSLLSRNTPAEALRVLEAALERFESATDLPTVRVTAWTLVAKGEALMNLNRADGALAVWEECVSRYAETTDVETLEAVGQSLALKSSELNLNARHSEALVTADEILRRFWRVPTPRLQEKVAWGLLVRGQSLFRLNRPDESIQAFDLQLSAFWDAVDPVIQRWVASALHDKGEVLGAMQRWVEMENSIEDFLSRFATATDPFVERTLVGVLVNRAQMLAHQLDVSAAIDAFNDVIERYGGSDDLEIVNEVTAARGLKHGLVAWVESQKG